MRHAPTDLIIHGGTVIDGTGGKMIAADVRVSKGRVQVVEPRGLPTTSDTLVFKAHGRIVCPGFIDVHAHDDLYLLAHPDGKFKVKQGVTTVIGGNCGVSPAPMSHAYRSDQLEQLRLLGSDGLPSAQNEFTGFGTYLAALDAAGLGIHYAGQVGHGMLRLAVMGPSSHAPSKAQSARMRLLLESCLDQGAIGLSLGLIYAPGAYADLSELVDLARVVESRQGIVTAHIRSEGGRVVEAVAEMIELARQSEAAVHISHHKTADPANRGKSQQTLALIDRARQAGLRVTLDAYPYRAGSTYLAAVLPVESLGEGVATLRVRLKDPSFRAQLRRKIESDPLDRWQSLLTGRDTYRLTIATCSTRPDYIGRCVQEIADAEGISPHDLVFDLIAAEGLGVGMISHAMDEGDVQRILSHPATMIGSDGIPPTRDSAPHPRLTGTFPRILGRYVRELGLIDLSEAVRRMTSLPAATFGLTGKGRLAPGMDADLVVFDPLTVIDRSTYEQPYQSPEGIELVLIGGCPALIHDRLTYAAQGRVLTPTR